MKQLLAFTFLTVALYANSGGPGQGYAYNAPTSITVPHVIMVHKIQVMVAFFTGGFLTVYVPGETYTIGVTVTGANERGFGFQAAVQSGNDVAGELLLNSSSSNAEINGDYIQHSSRTTSGSWVFDWIAPSTDLGEVTFSVSGLATGGVVALVGMISIHHPKSFPVKFH